MSRVFSAAALREMLAQTSGEVFHQLLTISHPDMTTIRVVDNTQDVVSRGNTYTAFPFGLSLPADATERLPVAQLSISNVDRRLVDEIRSLSGPMTATLEIVTATTPDTVEVGPFVFDIVSAEYDRETITATLAYEPILAEPFPADSFDPQRFPGLFGSA
jgi:ABC-type Fe3+-hydroxamate transport system substrate-binding protein